MAGAGITVVECLRVVAKTGDNVVGELLRGCGTFLEWDHYPPNDVYDPESHAQYYYHAHPPEGRSFREHGHFHLFLRPKGMPEGIVPASVPDFVPPAGENDALSHLVAISMDRHGMPVRLFTTNRWVTGEAWYRAEHVLRMLDRFVVDVVRPNWLINRWITAMVKLFRPQIEDLIRERDNAIDRWTATHRDANVFEDRRLDVTSVRIIDVRRHIAAVTAALQSLETSDGQDGHSKPARLAKQAAI